jgi:hypothetical protein
LESPCLKACTGIDSVAPEVNGVCVVPATEVVGHVDVDTRCQSLIKVFVRVSDFQGGTTSFGRDVRLDIVDCSFKKATSLVDSALWATSLPTEKPTILECLCRVSTKKCTVGITD